MVKGLSESHNVEIVDGPQEIRAMAIDFLFNMKKATTSQRCGRERKLQSSRPEVEPVYKVPVWNNRMLSLAHSFSLASFWDVNESPRIQSIEMAGCLSRNTLNRHESNIILVLRMAGIKYGCHIYIQLNHHPFF
ncbi:uncharacterized protein H6S33_011117 [Morchella sextelata]|uniref:uncharacterized protein n=1 Tax=Morchella sextelata TaxID=1174677 RepID=UPI001D0510B8|nr:uncharacterized protein H6S33_011117 [Morchella sextelata]KAH0611852.1 hypothetical protein H6S33_011117 [Morchella sextelata]